MYVHWSPTLKDAIREVLERTEKEGGILDAYAAAARIQSELPNENVALEDIISALLRGRGAIQAIEFSPPAGSILEVVMAGSNGEPDSADDRDDAIVVPA